MLWATADDGPEGDAAWRLALMCARYPALVDAALEGLALSHEKWSALVALPSEERAARLDASTLAGRLAALSPLERTAVVEALDRYADVLGTRHHDAALRAAGARPA